MLDIVIDYGSSADAFDICWIILHLMMVEIVALYTKMKWSLFALIPGADSGRTCLP